MILPIRAGHFGLGMELLTMRLGVTTGGRGGDFAVEPERPLVLLLRVELSVSFSEEKEARRGIAGIEEVRRMTLSMRVDHFGFGIELFTMRFGLTTGRREGFPVEPARPLVLPLRDEMSEFLSEETEAGREIVSAEDVRRMMLPLLADPIGLGLELFTMRGVTTGGRGGDFAAEPERPLVLPLRDELLVSREKAGTEEVRRMTLSLRVDSIGLGLELLTMRGVTTGGRGGDFAVEPERLRVLLLLLRDESSVSPSGRKIAGTEEGRRMMLLLREDHFGLGLEVPTMGLEATTG
jgi:hypothetical protein